METPEFLVAITSILAIFVGLPWMVFHYITKWKHAAKITPEDENLLDEMYNLARRLEDRVNTVERIVAADNPDFRPETNGSLTTQTRDWRDQPAASPFKIDRRS